MFFLSCGQAYAHMERVNGNLKAAQKLLLAALSFDYGNSAVLMVRSISINVPVAILNYLKSFN